MEEGYELIGLEDAEAPRWYWEDAGTAGIVGGTGLNNPNITLCRRREFKQGSQFEQKLYVRKILFSNSREGMKNVKRELEMLRRCEHQNILRYEDFSYIGSWDEPNAKLFTEYCEQGDLDQFTTTRKGPKRRLSVEQGIQVFSQLAQALLYIHHGIWLTREGTPQTAETRTARAGATSQQNGDWETILHRDIKPSNGQ